MFSGNSVVCAKCSVVFPSPYGCFSLLVFSDMECADVPLLTPSSKEMMSQALKATFSGFAKEQQRLGIPKGKRWQCSCGRHRGHIPHHDALPHSNTWRPSCGTALFLGSLSWKNPNIQAEPFSTTCRLYPSDRLRLYVLLTK